MPHVTSLGFAPSHPKRGKLHRNVKMNMLDYGLKTMEFLGPLCEMKVWIKRVG